MNSFALIIAVALAALSYTVCPYFAGPTGFSEGELKIIPWIVFVITFIALNKSGAKSGPEESGKEKGSDCIQDNSVEMNENAKYNPNDSVDVKLILTNCPHCKTEGILPMTGNKCPNCKKELDDSIPLERTDIVSTYSNVTLKESIGIETLGNTFTKLINSGTPIPYERKEVFSTAADNQTEINITVLSGESLKANKNAIIGEFRLIGIPKASKGNPQIEVSFCVISNAEFVLKAKNLNDDTKVEVMKKGENGQFESFPDMSEKIDGHTRNKSSFYVDVDDDCLVKNNILANNAEISNSQSSDIAEAKEIQSVEEKTSTKSISKIKVVFLFPFACIVLFIFIAIFCLGVSAPFNVGGVAGLVLGLVLAVLGVWFALGVANQFRLFFSKDPEKKHKGADGICTFGLVGLFFTVVFSAGGVVVELVAPSHPKSNKISKTVKHTEIAKVDSKNISSDQLSHFEFEGISFEYPSTLSAPDKAIFDIDKVRKMLSPSGVEILSVVMSPDMNTTIQVARTKRDITIDALYEEKSSLADEINKGGINIMDEQYTKFTVDKTILSANVPALIEYGEKQKGEVAVVIEFLDNGYDYSLMFIYGNRSHKQAGSKDREEVIKSIKFRCPFP